MVLLPLEGGGMMESSFEEDSFDCCSVCGAQRKWEELERALQKEKVKAVKEDGYWQKADCRAVGEVRVDMTWVRAESGAAANGVNF